MSAAEAGGPVIRQDQIARLTTASQARDRAIADWIPGSRDRSLADWIPGSPIPETFRRADAVWTAVLRNSTRDEIREWAARDERARRRE